MLAGLLTARQSDLYGQQQLIAVSFKSAAVGKAVGGVGKKRSWRKTSQGWSGLKDEERLHRRLSSLELARRLSWLARALTSVASFRLAFFQLVLKKCRTALKRGVKGALKGL